MTHEHSSDSELLKSLSEVYGDEIELIAEDGTALVFSIKSQFKLGDTVYAALQSADMRKEDEVELFRVIYDQGEPQLESIEDDEEWEAASEAYDDRLFGDSERP